MVMSTVCHDSKGNWHLMQSQDRRGLKLWVHGNLPFGGTVAAIDLLVISDTPVKLEVDQATYVVPVPVCERQSLSQVIDLCCGLGGFTVTSSQLGFSLRSGVDQNGRWKDLFEQLHPGATFCCGDLLDSSVLRKLMGQGLFHGVICSGVSCQPHSILGDRRGMSDPRAQSLPKTLSVSWLMQAAVVILECTPEVLRDPQAQELLRQFTVSTGYRMTQSILKLGNSWCTRRDRWIAVLTAPVLPMCELPDMPTSTPIQCIRDIIPEFPCWHQFEQDQLTLNLYELSKYYQYAAGGIEGVIVKMHEKLPTLLHSAGNQLYTCACGCRAALSEERLRQRGLIGVLIPLGTTQVHMNVVMQHCRYLHPVEMWALMGGHPETNMGRNLRLAMAGVGQAVAPMMGFWIFAHVRQCLDRVLEVQPIQPSQAFDAYMHEIIQACRAKWPVNVPSMIAATAEDPIEDELPGLITISRPFTGEPDVQMRVTTQVTAAQVLAAEVSLGTAPSNFQVRVDGEAVESQAIIPTSALVSLVPPDWNPSQVYADKVVPCCLDVDSFLQSVRASDAFDLGHVNDPARLCVVRHPEMSQVERLSILSLQGPVWGDDEVLHGLIQTALNTDDDQFVTVWDPLLITGLAQQDNPATWQQLVTALRPMATVISAVLLGGHWIPLVWRIDTVGAKLHTIAVTPEFEGVLQSLSRVIDLYRGGAMGVWNAHGTCFVPSGHCGALVLVFVRHLLWGWPLVDDIESLQRSAETMRADFANQITDPCLRPYLAGLGVSVQSRLAELLGRHGVPSSESVSRAAAAIKALGEDGIVRALDSDNAWRELKWLGNQARPMHMFLKPSELQMQIDRREKDRPIGHKKHKQPRSQKGKGKGKASQVSVDPMSLRLESGIFQSEGGQALSQIGLSHVGPSVAGVVVVSVLSIEPYLKAAHPLSSGPLALFVVDSVDLPVTNFQVTAERVPLVCTLNSEPLLVDGFLIQLGAVRVQRAPSPSGGSVKTIPTCVVKAMVFRDQTQVAWKEVTSHPLLHVFSQVPPLLQCQDSECCGCECWHRSLDFPMDSPVLELWGKQWLRLDFRATNPDQAELFTAHLRLPEHMQLQVQHFSGHGGVYLEPKSIDGRHPSPDYQVIWMPRSDDAQLMLQRQTVPNIVGLARLGLKMGLRCKTEHAAEVFATLRPGHTFLPPGKRQTYLVGPFGFGTLQASVAQVLHEHGWTAKPIQAVSAKTHVQGLMFRVQSVQEPPKKVLHLAHGDVVISKEVDDELPAPVAPKVVATQATESMVSKPMEGDYIQLNDPWARAASKLPSKTPSFQIGNPLEDMTQKVIAEVMSQLPKTGMEVDGDASQDARVLALEQQVQDLHGQTQALAVATKQSAHETAVQVQELRGQLQQQSVHFESAIATQAASMQTFQETFQEQFKQQVHQQQSMLDGMFSKQMTQFEHLLAKRPRQE